VDYLAGKIYIVRRHQNERDKIKGWAASLFGGTEAEGASVAKDIWENLKGTASITFSVSASLTAFRMRFHPLSESP
jgi:hypothetical protein